MKLYISGETVLSSKSIHKSTTLALKNLCLNVPFFFLNNLFMCPPSYLVWCYFKEPLPLYLFLSGCTHIIFVPPVWSIMAQTFVFVTIIYRPSLRNAHPSSLYLTVHPGSLSTVVAPSKPFAHGVQTIWLHGVAILNDDCCERDLYKLSNKNDTVLYNREV